MKKNYSILINISASLFFVFMNIACYAQINFTEIADINLELINRGDVVFGDLDNDGDQDLILCGEGLTDDVTKLYINENGNFIEDVEASLSESPYGALALADIDGDNDLDLVISGAGFGENTLLYLNNGEANFSQDMSFQIEEGQNGDITFADVDGDGDEDLMVTGNGPYTKLYRNNSGQFIEITESVFEGLDSSTIDFADIDGDNDLDVLVTGENLFDQRRTTLYENNGTGIYTEVENTPFQNIRDGAADFADIDGDGDLDLAIAGSYDVADLYRNDGNGVFTLIPYPSFQTVSFAALQDGDLLFSDLDGDSDPDLIITGADVFNDPYTLIYENINGNFVELSDVDIIDVQNSNIYLADVDNDGKKDLFVSGDDENGDGFVEFHTRIYRNESTVSISEFSKSEVSLNVYPNPAIDIVFISSFPEIFNNKTVNIEIRDNMGALILKKSVSRTEISITGIDVSTLSSGLYSLCLSDDKLKMYSRLIVQ